MIVLNRNGKLRVRATREEVKEWKFWNRIFTCTKIGRELGCDYRSVKKAIITGKAQPELITALNQFCATQRKIMSAKN